LHRIIGRKAGSLPGYGYSSAMKEAGFAWDADKLERFMANADAVVPGNNMKPYGGLASTEDRGKGHRFPAVSHDRSTVTHLAKQKRFPGDPCQRSLGQTRSAQSNAWKEMEPWLRSVRTRSKSPLKAVALSSLARQSAR
jgi:hypothetical protein